jgi:hypothetical protein
VVDIFDKNKDKKVLLYHLKWISVNRSESIIKYPLVLVPYEPLLSSLGTGPGEAVGRGEAEAEAVGGGDTEAEAVGGGDAVGVVVAEDGLQPLLKLAAKADVTSSTTTPPPIKPLQLVSHFVFKQVLKNVSKSVMN